jgi:hypothetical protein
MAKEAQPAKQGTAGAPAAPPKSVRNQLRTRISGGKGQSTAAES